MSPLPRQFYRRDARKVARDLLGQVLISSIGGNRTSGRIIETEAYLGEDDLASHSFRGPTRRNKSMFLEGGYAYVYFIYGMYYCFNVVTGVEGTGEAVLIRGIEPIEGIEIIQERRGKTPRRASELTNGPGKLAIGLAIGPELDGEDLVSSARLWIEHGVDLRDSEIVATPRIGITKSTEQHWRWSLRK